jgi:hypothetical protein
LSAFLAENDDTFAIMKSVRDLHQVAEGLSDGDLERKWHPRTVGDARRGTPVPRRKHMLNLVGAQDFPRVEP